MKEEIITEYNNLYQELSKYTPNKYIKIILNSLLLWME